MKFGTSRFFVAIEFYETMSRKQMCLYCKMILKIA
jgi:hypothetical protein